MSAPVSFESQAAANGAARRRSARLAPPSSRRGFASALAAALLALVPPAWAGGVSDKLLLSSAWCSFSYNATSGTTKTTRAQFFANGTYALGSQRESVSSGRAGSVYGQNQGGGNGRWQVRKGELYLAEGNAALEPVATQVKKNSNGYPIIVADGVEYMHCR